MSEVKRYKVKATELHGLDVELSGHVAVVVMEGDYHAESARADTAVRELAKVKAELNETWIDEHQTVWTRPTAWAYMQVCKAHDKHQARADRAEAVYKELAQIVEGLPKLNNLEIGDVKEVLARALVRAGYGRWIADALAKLLAWRQKEAHDGL